MIMSEKKLKTLKDIKEWIDVSSDNCCCDNANRLYDDLRSAAREWVNKWRNEIKEIEQRNKEWEAEDILADRPACAIPDFSEEIQTYLGSIAAFKHFFNLEEK